MKGLVWEECFGKRNGMCKGPVIRESVGHWALEEENNIHSIWSTAGKKEHMEENSGEDDGVRPGRGLQAVCR